MSSIIVEKELLAEPVAINALAESRLIYIELTDG
jgi:hypothetical protein